jgi:enamine deaminase RidA (YjgF/YER057c/UK114 family)
MAELASRFRFSPGVAVEGPGLLFVSGQGGTDEHGQIIKDPVEQYVATFEAMRSVLNEAGADFSDVVDVVSYHVAFDDYPQFAEVKNRYFTGPVHPAWTALGVTRLWAPDQLIEIKCTAVIRDGR